jgi:hypothetical protein
MGSLEIVGLEWLGALALFLGFILLVRYLDHRERMAMIDRGLLPPQRSPKWMVPRGSAALRGGLITAMVGLAVTAGLYTMGYLLPPPLNAVPGKLGPWLLPGLIPLGVGAALVASHYLAPPPPQSDMGDTAGEAADADQRSDAATPTQRTPRDWRILGRGATTSAPETEDSAES